jgi:hypothetical protein
VFREDQIRRVAPEDVGSGEVSAAPGWKVRLVDEGIHRLRKSDAFLVSLIVPDPERSEVSE